MMPLGGKPNDQVPMTKECPKSSMTNSVPQTHVSLALGI